MMFSQVVFPCGAFDDLYAKSRLNDATTEASRLTISMLVYNKALCNLGVVDVYARIPIEYNI